MAPHFPDWAQIVELNEQRRQLPRPQTEALTLKNVTIFNGQKFEGPTQIGIKDGMIVKATDGDQELDCTGKFLIPGLIDCHCHPVTIEDIEKLNQNGVTTAMSMAGFTKEHMASIKGHAGLTDVLVAGIPATGPDNAHPKRMPGWPKDELLTEASQADDFVLRQINKGADYIKIISDVPGMSQEIVTALVDASKRHKKLTVCHAVEREPVRVALNAGADQLHHCPMDALLEQRDIDQFKSQGSIACPTLTMMEAVAQNIPRPGVSINTAKENVKALRDDGVPIICGSDANQAPGAPATVPFGTSIHRELELLVESGLTNLEAIRAATVLAAIHFGLEDRGVTTPGYRADLVLLSQDPLVDITAIRNIDKVWVGGCRYP
ncbi:MAG: hypothetical protein MMC23_007937 [Stictis urceolatum]|nr:hypothetical protein [Stictis urceolata]